MKGINKLEKVYRIGAVLTWKTLSGNNDRIEYFCILWTETARKCHRAQSSLGMLLHLLLGGAVDVLSFLLSLNFLAS